MLLTNVWHTYVKHLAGRSENFCPWKKRDPRPVGLREWRVSSRNDTESGGMPKPANRIPVFVRRLCEIDLLTRRTAFGNVRTDESDDSSEEPLAPFWPLRRTRQYTRRVACVTYFVRDGPPLPSARSKDYIFVFSSLKSTANEKMYTRLSLYCKRQIPLTYYSGRDSDNKSIEKNSLYNIVNIKSIFLR